MTVRAKNIYNKLNLPEFSMLVDNILLGMNRETLFVEQQPLVAALLADKRVYDQQSTKASMGTRSEITRRNTLRVELTQKMQELGNQVTALANNSAYVFELAGIPYTKEPQPTNDLQKPPTPRLASTGNPGEITVLGKKQNDNNSLTFYVSLEANCQSVVKIVMSKKQKRVISGLEPGRRYYVYYVIGGPRDQEMMSDVASIIVQ